MANEPYGSIMRGGVCYGGVGDPAVINQVSDNIAPKQETSTASKLITAGEYFVNADGDLCQCDVQIASGGTIIVGSNCHVINDGIGNELNSKTAVEDISSGFFTVTNSSITGASVFAAIKIGKLIILSISLAGTTSIDYSKLGDINSKYAPMSTFGLNIQGWGSRNANGGAIASIDNGTACIYGTYTPQVGGVIISGCYVCQ